KSILLLLPLAVFFGFFFVVPLANLLFQSFYTYDPTKPLYIDYTLTLQNYFQALGPTYLGVLWETLWISFVSTLVAVLLGYPLAYMLVRASSESLRSLLLIVLFLSFLLSSLVRAYSLVLILATNGIINTILGSLG